MRSGNGELTANTSATGHAQNKAATESRDTVKAVQGITGENSARSRAKSTIVFNSQSATELLDLFVQSATLRNGGHYVKMAAP